MSVGVKLYSKSFPRCTGSNSGNTMVPCCRQLTLVSHSTKLDYCPIANFCIILVIDVLLDSPVSYFWPFLLVAIKGEYTSPPPLISPNSMLLHKIFNILTNSWKLYKCFIHFRRYFSPQDMPVSYLLSQLPSLFSLKNFSLFYHKFLSLLTKNILHTNPVIRVVAFRTGSNFFLISCTSISLHGQKCLS